MASRRVSAVMLVSPGTSKTPTAKAAAVHHAEHDSNERRPRTGDPRASRERGMDRGRKISLSSLRDLVSLLVEEHGHADAQRRRANAAAYQRHEHDEVAGRAFEGG